MFQRFFSNKGAKGGAIVPEILPVNPSVYDAGLPPRARGVALLGNVYIFFLIRINIYFSVRVHVCRRRGRFAAINLYGGDSFAAIVY